MSSLDDALAQLTRTGSVTLAGERSARVRIAGVGLVVLWVLTIAAAAASLVFMVLALAAGVVVNPVAFVLPVGLAGLACAFPAFRRSHARLAARHAMPVTLTPAGFTVRGVGPIPWRDVLPPGNTFVPHQYDSGYELRAVMPLTPTGIRGVNSLSPQDRKAIGPAERRLGGGGPLHHLYVPSVQGLTVGETMRLFATAHHMFAGRAPRA